MKRTFVRLLSCLASVVLYISCQPESLVLPSVQEGGSVDVFFSVGSGLTKTSVADDGRTVSWDDGDRLALWAFGQDGTAVLQAERFSLYAFDGARAWFSAAIPAAMPAGNYTYHAVSPVPESVSGTSVTFRLPDHQDGRASSGSDIMVSDAAAGPALGPMPDPEDHSGMSMSMNHLTHLLRFYMPLEDIRMDGESVRTLVVTMPENVCGTVSADVTSPQSASLSEGTNVITLELKDPLHVSDASREYAFASIFPTSFSVGESMTVKMYSDTKVASVAPIDLRSRNMAAGHATSVALIPENVSNLCRLRFTIAANNLGEEVQTVTLTAPSGSRWEDAGSNVLVHQISGPTADHSFEILFEDESAYRSLSGKPVTVTYDSEHIRISESFDMPSMDSGFRSEIALNVPYLLFEDFSTVPSFSSNDAYGTSSAGDKGAYSFLNGWSGGRVGASQGACVRLACRRETSADYNARMDSAPLRGEIKSPVNLRVSFDYGADNRYGGIPIIADGNVGQTCRIGYITTNQNYSSGSDKGTFEADNSFYVKEYTGSWTNTPDDYVATIHDVPAASPVRISWRTIIEHQAGTTNTTAWLYVDNVKVQVAN